MWCSSNHFRTPMCARPRAPPPSRATPILGRGCGAEFCCASNGSGRRSNSVIKTMRRMEVPQRSVNCPIYQIIYEFGAEWRFQQARKEVSGTFVFLQDIAAIDNQDLAGDIGSFRRSEEANRGCYFVGRAGSEERGMQCGDSFRLR